MSVLRTALFKNKSLYEIVLKSNRLVPTNGLRFSSEIKENEEEERPIKYTTSAASRWQAKSSRMGGQGEKPRLWYEPYVIIASISVFLIYFCVVREENDIDLELSRSLYSRIDGLEEYQLKVSLQYNLDHNLDTTAIIKRLNELEQSKSANKE